MLLGENKHVFRWICATTYYSFAESHVFSVVIVVLYVLHSSKLVRNKTRLSCLMAIRPTSTYYLLHYIIYYMLLRKKGQMFTQRILISWHLDSDEQIMSVMFGVSFALPLSSQPCIILELPLPLPGCSSWSCCSRPWLESMPRNLDLKPLEHVAKSSIFCYSWVCRITLGIFSVFSFFSIFNPVWLVWPGCHEDFNSYTSYTVASWCQDQNSLILGNEQGLQIFEATYFDAM